VKLHVEIGSREVDVTRWDREGDHVSIGGFAMSFTFEEWVRFVAGVNVAIEAYQRVTADSPQEALR